MQQIRVQLHTNWKYPRFCLTNEKNALLWLVLGKNAHLWMVFGTNAHLWLVHGKNTSSITCTIAFCHQCINAGSFVQRDFALWASDFESQIVGKLLFLRFYCMRNILGFLTSDWPGVFWLFSNKLLVASLAIERCWPCREVYLQTAVCLPKESPHCSHILYFPQEYPYSRYC